jgi:hypothetical protein
VSQYGDIQIEVVEADGLDYETDVLVLKHAQALYGLDELVAKRLSVTTEDLPRRDECRVFRDPKGLGARAVVFVGVNSIWEFTYHDVRRFAREALSAVAEEIPEASSVALTLHGVGFGLDEVECFEAEVAGILDAIDRRDVPRTLRRVDVVEIDRDRVERMQGRLKSLLRGEEEGGRDAGKADGEKPHVVVAMPFHKDFKDTFRYGMSTPIRDQNLLCERIDEQVFTGDVMTRLMDRIRTARFVVADLTGNNANVFLEVGFAWGCEVPTILVSKKGSGKLHFDVQGQHCLEYDDIHDLEEKLGAELAGLLDAG